MSRNKDEAMITTVETTYKDCISRNKDEAMITTVETTYKDCMSRNKDEAITIFECCFNSSYHCFIFVP
jgi:hypothetical protein